MKLGSACIPVIRRQYPMLSNKFLNIVLFVFAGIATIIEGIFIILSFGFLRLELRLQTSFFLFELFRKRQ